MPLNPIPQLDEVDDVIDALTGPTSLEVYEAMLPYDNDMVAAAGIQRALAAEVGTLDSDLVTIAALTPSNDDVLQRKSGAWANRTIAQLLTDLGIAAAYQPLDSDLTSIAALTTTSFGRSLLALADAAALLAAAGAQASDSDLTALAGLNIAADKLPYGNGSHTMALADFTAAGRALVDDADAAAQRVTLGVAAALITENVQTASYTLALTDAGKRVVMNVGSANDLTVPTNGAVAFPIGTTIEVFQLGAGQTTFVMTSLTSQSPSGKKKLTGQYSSATLAKRDTDTWSIAGDLAA